MTKHIVRDGLGMEWIVEGGEVRHEGVRITWLRPEVLHALLRSSAEQPVRLVHGTWYLASDGFARADPWRAPIRYLTRDFVTQLLAALGGPPPLNLMTPCSPS